MNPLKALERLLDLATGFCRSQTFFTACQLGVFEELGQEPMTAEELSRRLGLHPQGGRRLLEALIQTGLVERDKGLYRNSELGEFCTSQAPVELAALSQWGHPFYRMWEFLPDALREYRPRTQQALGVAPDQVFAGLYADPARLRRFVQMMHAFSVPVGELVAEHFDFTSFRCVLDVAGGSGGLVAQVGLRHPHLRGIVMDLAPVCAVAEEYLQAGGLAGRFTTVAADMFTGPYPTGADVIVLGHTLHNWGDEKCRMLLDHCFEALPAGGALLVSEKVLNDDYSGTRYALMLDLTMLVTCEPGARERSEAEYRALLQEAGFGSVELIRIDAPRDLMVARKP